MSHSSPSRPQNNGRNQGQKNQERALPVHEIRFGKLKAAIWENKNGQQGTWFSVTLTRSYLDAQKKWGTASSFGKEDLLVLGELLRQAYLWIAREHGGAASNITEDEYQGDGN